MKNLPVVSGKNLIRALRKYGFWVERQKDAPVQLNR
jgi:predicted RNA binding protein YcfA (HicA-like mRNA interferase family)